MWPMSPPRTYIEQTRIIERNVRVTKNIVVDETRSTMARPFHELGNHPESAGGVHLERVSAESRRQWQGRSADLAQFREQRALQERQAAGWRPARGAAVRSPRTRAVLVRWRFPLLQSRHRFIIMPRRESRSARGPRRPRHGDRPDPNCKCPWNATRRRRLRHTDGPGSASPMPHHLGQVRTPATGQPLHPGMEIPRIPAVRRKPISFRATNRRHGQMLPGCTAPQYTHRQPPPPPRPATRHERQEGRRNP